MPDKDDPIAEARKRQAEIVAEQEAAQSVPPTPTQEEHDKAKLGIGGFSAPADTDASKTKAAEADKPAAGYTTRTASKND